MLSDFVDDRNDSYVERRNAYNSYSSMKQDRDDGDRQGYPQGRGRRGRGRGYGRGENRQYINSQEFQDRKRYADSTDFNKGFRGNEREGGDFRRDNDRGNYRQDFNNSRRGFSDNRHQYSQQRSYEDEGYNNDRPQYSKQRSYDDDSYSQGRRGNDYDRQVNNEGRRNFENDRQGFGDGRRGNRQGYNDGRRSYDNERPRFDEGRRSYDNDRQGYNEGRRSYENERPRFDEGRRSYERDPEPRRRNNDNYSRDDRQDYADTSYRGGRGRSQGRGFPRGQGRGGRGRGDLGRSREDIGRPERNVPPRMQRLKNPDLVQNVAPETEYVDNSSVVIESQPFPPPPSVNERKPAPVADVVNQEDLNIVVQNQGERKSYSKDRRAKFTGKTRVQDHPSNAIEHDRKKVEVQTEGFQVPVQGVKEQRTIEGRAKGAYYCGWNYFCGYQFSWIERKRHMMGSKFVAIVFSS